MKVTIEMLRIFDDDDRNFVVNDEGLTYFKDEEDENITFYDWGLFDDRVREKNLSDEVDLDIFCNDLYFYSVDDVEKEFSFSDVISRWIEQVYKKEYVGPSDKSNLQPNPIPNNLPAVWDLVIQDMQNRDKVGQERYGTRLQPHNGRDVLFDAYSEALDLSVYLRQAIFERDGK